MLQSISELNRYTHMWQSRIEIEYLVHRVFRTHQQVQRTTALSFRLGWGSYTLCGRIRYSCIYIARMSPTLSGSSALQRVKLGDALKIRNGILFDFYLGLPHMYAEHVLDLFL